MTTEKVYIAKIGEDDTEKVPAVLLNYESVAFLDEMYYDKSFHVDNTCSYRLFKRRSSRLIDNVLKENPDIVKVLNTLSLNSARHAVWNGKEKGCLKKL